MSRQSSPIASAFDRFYYFLFPEDLRPNIDTLVNAEATLGATIFGSVPAGHRREFFNYRKNIWIWYESWEENDQFFEKSIRYTVRPDGVFKRTNGGVYTKITGAELENFRSATHAYLKLIKTELYKDSIT